MAVLKSQKGKELYSPLRAFLLNLLIPGGGFFYIQEPAKGIFCLVPGLIIEYYLITQIYIISNTLIIINGRTMHPPLLHFGMRSLTLWMVAFFYILLLLYSAYSASQQAEEKNNIILYEDYIEKNKEIKRKINEIKNRKID